MTNINNPSSLLRRSRSVLRETLRAAALALLGATACAGVSGDGSDEWSDDDWEVDETEQAITENAVLVPLANRTSLERSIVHVGGCTATLVRPQWVLTARHCVGQANGLPLVSVTVTHDNGASSPSTGIFLHPDPVVDAALIRLQTAINAGQPASVPLYTGNDAGVVNKSVTIYGYGGVTDLSRGVRTVNYIENNGSMQGSQSYNRKYLNITGTVPGDSGGPSFLSGQIVAVTGGNPYKTYARVFRDWANSLLTPATNNHLGSKVHFYTNVGPTGSVVLSGDVNGDGYVDIVQFNQSAVPNNNVYVIPGVAAGFGTMALWKTAFGATTDIPAVGDVDGDGKDDIIKFRQSDGKVFIAKSTGTSFSTTSTWHSAFSYPGETPRVADVNGDGRADVVTFVHYNDWGDVWVSLSCGTNTGLYPQGCNATNKFGDRILWRTSFSLMNEIPQVGDVNGDGLADLVTFRRSSGSVSVALSRRQSCTTNAQCNVPGVGGVCFTALGYCPQSLGMPAGSKTTWGSDASFSGETPTIADMNGDGKLDVANFETTTAYGRNGYFSVKLSNGSSFGIKGTWSTNVCRAGEVCFTGDIGRDGRADAFALIVGGADYFARSLAQ